jgi:predicted DNA-binding WGR domain protein
MEEIPDGVPIYLVHSNGRKFWEVTVQGRNRSVKYGKLREGSEQAVKTSSAEHPTANAAQMWA